MLCGALWLMYLIVTLRKSLKMHPTSRTLPQLHHLDVVSLRVRFREAIIGRINMSERICTA
jgi:hypothetical protein